VGIQLEMLVGDTKDGMSSRRGGPVKAAGSPRRMTWVEGARGSSRAAGHLNTKGRP
jgi:hypothetical protein